MIADLDCHYLNYREVSSPQADPEAGYFAGNAIRVVRRVLAQRNGGAA